MTVTKKQLKEWGRRGGKARGAAKRRGTRAYYRRLALLRVEKQKADHASHR